MKTRVICDTNIWYYLADGTINPSTLNDYSLIATFYNFEELISTPNILKNFKKVQAVAKAITTYSTDQILENAFLHIARNIDPYFSDTRYSYNLGIRNWAEIRKMAALDDSFVLTREIIYEYEKNIAHRADIGENIADIENKFASSVSAHSKELWRKGQKKYYRDRFKGILLELNEYLTLFSHGKVKLEGKHIKRFELFLTAFLQFSRNIEIAKFKVQPNDAFDLYNLVFVGPGDKYLTKEKRWIYLIIEAGLKDYLLI